MKPRTLQELDLATVDELRAGARVDVIGELQFVFGVVHQLQVQPPGREVVLL